MSRQVRAVITCDACRRSITFAGSSGVSIKDAVEIARDRYGWAIGSGPQGRDLCFDDRVAKIKFHEFVPGKGGWGWRCEVCQRAAVTAIHHEKEVRRNAAELQRTHFAEWGYGNRRP